MTLTHLLIRWLIDLAWLSIILVPAVLYARIGARHEKKGWLFFIMGLVIGILSLSAGRLATYGLTKIEISPLFTPFLPAVTLVVAYGIIIFAVHTLQDILYPDTENDSLDANQQRKQ